MYGTLRGALAGRKIAFDRDGYAATVEGRIVGVGKTIRIKSIHMKYELAVPADSRDFAHVAEDHALVPGTALPAPQPVFPRYVEQPDTNA